MTEVQKFNDKPKIDTLRMFVIEKGDIAGLEELMMGDPHRFIKLT